MPVHDWTRVEAGVFHAFHTTWIGGIQNALNEGLLPDEYYALADAPPRVRRRDVIEDEYVALRRWLAIRHVSGHRLVAMLEIVSPSNKDRAQHIEEFAIKAVTALERGVHLLLVDLFPPGRFDPYGIHEEIVARFRPREEPYDLPPDEPLTLASYAAHGKIDVYLEHLAVGAALPAMPLFLRPDRYINAPLEQTYQTAYRGMPAFLAQRLERVTRARCRAYPACRYWQTRMSAPRAPAVACRRVRS